MLTSISPASRSIYPRRNQQAAPPLFRGSNTPGPSESPPENCATGGESSASSTPESHSPHHFPMPHFFSGMPVVIGMPQGMSLQDLPSGLLDQILQGVPGMREGNRSPDSDSASRSHPRNPNSQSSSGASTPNFVPVGGMMIDLPEGMTLENMPPGFLNQIFFMMSSREGSQADTASLSGDTAGRSSIHHQQSPSGVSTPTIGSGTTMFGPPSVSSQSTIPPFLHPILHHHHPVQRAIPPLISALQQHDFDQIRRLLEQGATFKPHGGQSFADMMFAMQSYDDARELLNGLKSHGILSQNQIRQLLVRDIYKGSHLTISQRRDLMDFAEIPVVPLNESVYRKAAADREKRFQKPPTHQEQDMLARVMPVWQQLSDTHKDMIHNALGELIHGRTLFFKEPIAASRLPQPSFMDSLFGHFHSSQIRPALPSIPNATAGDFYSGSHFWAGGVVLPRILGLFRALDIMSENPQKKYRWFTQGASRGTPSYTAPEFNQKFPVVGKGVYRTDYVRMLASNFTDDFSLAMQTLKDRNGDRMDSKILDGADIAFTLDNGDGHDVAYRIQFKRDPETGKLKGDSKIAESVPEHVEATRRPAQDAALKNLDYLVQAYFMSVLHWKKEDVPKIDTQVMYLNNQVNGYCTSTAIDHMLADDWNDMPNQTDPSIPGWATTIQMEKGQPKLERLEDAKDLRDKPDPTLSTTIPGWLTRPQMEDGKPKVDSHGNKLYEHVRLKTDFGNNTFFMKRLQDKLVQARLIQALPDTHLSQEQLDALPMRLGEIYWAMRMDQVNSAEGRVHDHHETRMGNQEWRDMVAGAEAEYDQDPFWQQHFESKGAYVDSKVADTLLRPVQIGNEMRLMDAREVKYYQSREKQDPSEANPSEVTQTTLDTPSTEEPALDASVQDGKSKPSTGKEKMGSPFMPSLSLHKSSQD